MQSSLQTNTRLRTIREANSAVTKINAQKSWKDCTKRMEKCKILWKWRRRKMRLKSWADGSRHGERKNEGGLWETEHQDINSCRCIEGTLWRPSYGAKGTKANWNRDWGLFDIKRALKSPCAMETLDTAAAVVVGSIVATAGTFPLEQQQRGLYISVCVEAMQKECCCKRMSAASASAFKGQPVKQRRRRRRALFLKPFCAIKAPLRLQRPTPPCSLAAWRRKSSSCRTVPQVSFATCIT